MPGIRGWTLGGLILVLGLAAAGCDPERAPEPGAPSLLPGDYAGRFVEVRGCRPSIDHDLQRILIRTDPAVAARYDTGPYPFATGTVIVKEEFSDPTCRVRSGFTLMRKEPAGYAEAAGDWQWQRLDADGKVREDAQLARCAGCHAASACRARDFACAEP